MGQIGYFFNLIFTFPIFNVLMFLHYIIGDFALSIIVLTVLLRLALFPLMLKQLKSSKAMQQIQPLIADVKKQYPKDQRAQLEATQAIYKEYSISPLAGCLPLLLQLPVLYGLFYALNSVLRGGTVTSINNLIYPFLPKLSLLTNITSLTDFRWFTFLSPAWHIPLSQPDPTHILPILAGLATFAQLRMSQPRNIAGSTATNPIASQMQIMQFIMPFFTFFIALGFPAGLALYWTTSSVFSMVQQYFVTGWGQLLTLPSFLTSRRGSNSSRDSGKSKTYSGDSRKETKILKEANGTGAEVATEGGPIGSNLQYNGNGKSNGNGNGNRRRPRSGSASARRRANANVPRRNPSNS